MTRIPKGFRNYADPLATAMEHSRGVFFDSFASWGYRVFSPSRVQLLSIYWDRLPAGVRDRIITLTTPFGEQGCLCPDLTLSAVSHLFAHHAPEERPLRICYAGQIFRVPNPPETHIERYQAGAELLGWEGHGADVEILSLMMNTLDRLYHEDAIVVLGDVNIMEHLLRTVEPSIAGALRDALLKGSLSDYFSILESRRVPEPSLSHLSSLPTLKGGTRVLEEATRKLPGDSPLSELRQISRELCLLGFEDRIRFDLSLLRRLGYYSGPVFEIYSPRTGKALGGGGRYDRLLNLYGIVGQAVGFGLDLELVASSASRGETSHSETIMAWTGELDPAEALSAAESIKRGGLPVELSWTPDRKASIALARRRRYRWWTDLSGETVFDLAKNTHTKNLSWLETQKRC
ncbi:MAG: ATP phosphoribosyltransferase regulatory subunit [Thermovirgaceae bacterium]